MPVMRDGPQEEIMKLWQGQLYLDDRLFILDLQQAKKDGQDVWAIVTRRNVKGFPPRRSDTFQTKNEAVQYLKQVEPSVPRISLSGKSPSTPISYKEYVIWCKSKKIPTSIQIYEMNEQNRGELIIEDIDPDEL
jgi:hypothetical protein